MIFPTPDYQAAAAEKIILKGENFDVILADGKPAIRINVGGHVIVMTAEKWHEAARQHLSEAGPMRDLGFCEDCGMQVVSPALPNAAPQAVLTGSEAPHMSLTGQAASSHRPTAEPAVAAPPTELEKKIMPNKPDDKNAAPQEEHTEAKGIPDAAGHHPAVAAFSLDKQHQCCMGGPLRVDPCVSCPEHPIQEFRAWLDTYGHKTEYDRHDMAACWYAGKRSAVSAREDSASLQAKIEKFRALKADWNSYGAEAFDPRTIDLALEIARKLGPEWKCVPCADGPSVWLYRGDEEEILEVRTSYEVEKVRK